MNSNQVWAGASHVSTKSIPTEVLTSSSSTLENITALSVFQSINSQDSDPTDWFPTESFQSANNIEDQNKDSSDTNFQSTTTFETEDESEYGTENESDLEEFTNYLRDESILKNVEPCLVEDDNCSISHDKKFIRELSNSEQETLCPCTKTTVTDVMLMCLVLGLRHNLSWEAQIDILKNVQCYLWK